MREKKKPKKICNLIVNNSLFINGTFPLHHIAALYMKTLQQKIYMDFHWDCKHENEVKEVYHNYLKEHPGLNECPFE